MSRTFIEIHIYLSKWKFAIVEGLRSRDQTGVVVDGPAVHVNICRALSNKYELETLKKESFVKEPGK